MNSPFSDDRGNPAQQEEPDIQADADRLSGSEIASVPIAGAVLGCIGVPLAWMLWVALTRGRPLSDGESMIAVLAGFPVGAVANMGLAAVLPIRVARLLLRAEAVLVLALAFFGAINVLVALTGTK